MKGRVYIGIRDLFKRKPHVGLSIKEATTSDCVSNLDSETDDLDKFRAELRAKSSAKHQPQLLYGAVPNPPDIEGFDFSNVLIARNITHDDYLLDGFNAGRFIRDMDYINGIVAQTADIIIGLPDFTIDRFITAWTPVPEISYNDTPSTMWRYSHFYFERPTPTGKQKKYPLRVVWYDIYSLQQGAFYYNKSGILGKGGVFVRVPDQDPDFYGYSMDFIDGRVSHIWANFFHDGKKVLYNKNTDI